MQIFARHPMDALRKIARLDQNDESIYYKTYILSKRASQENPVRVADFFYFYFFAKPRGMPSLFYITRIFTWLKPWRLPGPVVVCV
jgi:hypothetical protein